MKIKVLLLCLIVSTTFAGRKVVKNTLDSRYVEIVLVPMEQNAKKVRFTIAPNSSEARTYQGWGLESMHYRILHKEWNSNNEQTINEFEYFKVIPEGKEIKIRPDYRAEEQKGAYPPLAIGLILLVLSALFVIPSAVQFGAWLLIALLGLYQVKIILSLLPGFDNLQQYVPNLWTLNPLEAFIVIGSCIALLILHKGVTGKVDAQAAARSSQQTLFYSFIISFGIALGFLLYGLIPVLKHVMNLEMLIFMIFAFAYTVLILLLSFKQTRITGAYTTAAFYFGMYLFTTNFILGIATYFLPPYAGFIPTLERFFGPFALFNFLPLISALTLKFLITYNRSGELS